MERYLLFDSGCSRCTKIAHAIEQEVDGPFTVRSLWDPHIQELLNQANPDWQWQPTLLEVSDDKVRAHSGLPMGIRLVMKLGPRQALRLVKLVHRFSVSRAGVGPADPGRRHFLRRSGSAFAALALLLGWPKSLLFRKDTAAGVSPLQQENPPMGLPPDVEEFIRGTYLSHAVAFPDPNETVETLRLYLETQRLQREGRGEEALRVLSQAVERYPGSRSIHAGLGDAFWQRYHRMGQMEDLRSAVEEFIRAADIGIHYDKVRYTWRIATGLARLGDTTTLNQFFQRALAVPDNIYLTHLHYAQGLHLLGDPRTEGWYRRAIQFQPEGNVDAVAYYAEWLLDQDREGQVLQLLSPTEHVQYLHFLRGVALERQGRLDEAREEYEHYIRFSADFPAPDKYRIPGSSAQQGITFEGDVGAQTHCQTHLDLSATISCEAGGETQGGMRMVGWTIRTRVFRGDYACCLSVDNSGATLCDQYYSVIHQPNQFVCCCTRTPTTDHVASDVWYGWAPDPLTGYCPCGTAEGPWCSAQIHCSCNSQNGAHQLGPTSFRGGICAGCACPNIGACFDDHGQVCGDGITPENCFYNIHCTNQDCC